MVRAPSNSLAEYKSSSGNGVYHILKGKDGVVYCTCWQWKKNRTCWHLENFMASDNAKLIKDRNLDDDIQTAIQEALAHLNL